MRGLQSDGFAFLQLRRLRGWTQAELAQACDCSTRTIRNVESSKRIDGNTLSRIADALATRLSEITCERSKYDHLQREAHKRIVSSWWQAFMAEELEKLLSYHHPDTVLENPGTEGLPGGGTFNGLEQARGHFEVVYSIYEPVSVRDERLEAVSDRVFFRATATARVRATGKEFTAKYFNEFQFRDRLIIRRLSIQDLTGHRRSLHQE